MRPAPISHFGTLLGVLLLACASFSMNVEAGRLKRTSLSKFDGTYSVEITTQEGSCEKMYRGSVTITNGRITGTSDPEASASGLIEDDGTVSLSLRGHDQIAHVGGKVSGRHGRGTWSSPTAECGGLWQAERQG